jgi:type III secretory pathway component EscU
LYGKNTKSGDLTKKKVAHFGEIVIKMYRTEMMNSEYVDSRQNDPNIHQKRKKLHKKWQYHDLRNSKYDPLAAVVTLA